MPTIHQLISEYQEDEEQGVKVFMDCRSIKFELSDCFKIKYVESNGLTKVQCEEANVDTKVEGNMIQVFYEDFKPFLVNRKAILTSFSVCNSSPGTDNQNNIIDSLELALMSREGKLRVKRIWFDPFNTEQIISLLKFMDPEVMTIISCHSPNIDKVIDFLTNWNKGCRLDVTFRFGTFSREELTSLKRMINYSSTFNQIQMNYQNTGSFNKEELIFSIKHLKLTFHGYHLFKIRFQNPSEENQTDRLSLQKPRLLEVFGNPLLMQMIVKEIDYPDDQSFRKVSRDIRRCIDSLKPDPRIRGYSIKRKIFKNPNRESSSKQNIATFDTIISYKNYDEKYIRYRSRELLHDENDWKVHHFVYCGDQLIERVVNDFKVNLLYQKSTMNHLELERNEQMLELMGNVLRSRNSPLSVKMLEMKVTDEKDVMSILPYLDSVERIEICKSEGNLKLIDVPNLIQWKNALRLNLSNRTIKNSIQELNVINFQSVSIDRMHSLSTNDIIYMKENLVNSVNLDQFFIRFENLLIDENLYISLPPFRRDTSDITWYFPMSSPEKFLQMILIIRNNYQSRIHIRSVCRNEVPEAYL